MTTDALGQRMSSHDASQGSREAHADLVVHLRERLTTTASSLIPLPAGYRPRIGILAASSVLRDGGWPVYAGDAASVHVLFEAGATPLLLPSLPVIQGYDPWDVLIDDEAFAEVFRVLWPVLCQLDGILLTGGGDLYSCLYGQVLHPQTGMLDLWRDVWERYVALIAWLLGLPTLGLCRGMQVMHAARGGSLYQDLRSQWPRQQPPLVRHRAWGRVSADKWVEHPVIIAPQSKLAALLRGPQEQVLSRQQLAAVLSMHHQMVGYVTPQGSVIGAFPSGIAVGAVAPDGVIEAMEDQDPRRYWLGVQFHPEWVPHLCWAQRLFTSLVEASRSYAALPRETLAALEGDVRAWLRQCDHTVTRRSEEVLPALPTVANPVTDALAPLAVEEHQ